MPLSTPSIGPVRAAEPIDEPPRRGRKSRPQARLRALVEDAPVSDWASLSADLAGASARATELDDPIEWRIHDRTHVEFAIDYPIAERPIEQVWEAYFFVPESLRLHESTYTKKAIYDDLHSYVRFAVPELPFAELSQSNAGSQLEALKRSLELSVGKPADSIESAEAMRSLRLFACMVRASGLNAIRAIEREISEPNLEPLSVKRRCSAFVLACTELVRALRSTIEGATSRGVPDDVACATRWVDEDVSLAIEALCADAAVKLEQHAGVDAAVPDLAERVAACAVAEARHRAEKGYKSVGSADASEREVEHLEFRRHVLKRFTASVLWLTLEVREGASWALHILYALAAGMAMGFAVLASFGTTGVSDNLFRYAMIVVIAYMVKDRLKAFLQGAFTDWIAKRYPDRLWRIRDRERGHDVGRVHERAGFLPFRSVPEEVLSVRRSTREHALEEQARPERVLWHQKEVRVQPASTTGESHDFRMLTEIFRLNLAHWLTHTDDPNRKMVFADPTDASIYSAKAKRVYNINVVYRLRSSERDAKSPWHRIRIVVSRKGIIRIDAIG